MAAAEPPSMPQLQDQSAFWDQWTAQHRVGSFRLAGPNARQAETVEAWMRRIGRRDLDVLEVGCGSGWMCERLARYGRVTGTDLSPLAIEEARRRCPEIAFRAGDFGTMALPSGSVDVVVTLEVLSHVADARAFLDRIADVLRPGGHLMLATQNRPVLERWSEIPPQGSGQLRRWVGRAELAGLLRERFDVVELSSVYPVGDRGVSGALLAAPLLRVLRGVGVEWRYLRLLEKCMLGHTLMALGRRR